MAAWSVVSRTEYEEEGGAMLLSLCLRRCEEELAAEEEREIPRVAVVEEFEDTEGAAREKEAPCIRRALRECFVPDVDQPCPLNLRLVFDFLRGMRGGTVGTDVAASVDAGGAEVELSSSDGTSDAAKSSGRWA